MAPLLYEAAMTRAQKEGEGVCTAHGAPTPYIDILFFYPQVAIRVRNTPSAKGQHEVKKKGFKWDSSVGAPPTLVGDRERARAQKPTTSAPHFGRRQRERARALKSQQQAPPTLVGDRERARALKSQQQAPPTLVGDRERARALKSQQQAATESARAQKPTTSD